MFMYPALHNTHAPIEAPPRFVNMYHTGDVKKDTFAAMVSVVDETVANVTAALRTAGMWDNTILVWITDNGSPVQVGGSNHPLKGGKSTNWEGGVRVPTFVSGGALPDEVKGKVLTGLVHVSDWYATFSELAGLAPAADPAGVSPPDSISVWRYISGAVDASPRTELVHDHRMFTNASRNHNGDSCKGQRIFEKPGYDALGAIRVGKYKLIVGDEYEASWFGEFSPNNTRPPDLNAVACVERPCLFYIEDDPTEHVDLASKMPDMVRQLWARFNLSNSDHHPRKISPTRDIPSFCKAVIRTGGWVATPWQKEEVSV